jgi:DNA-directed RNA polymerase delta subunit
MLVAARLRHIAATKWGTRQYLKMDRIEEQLRELTTEKNRDNLLIIDSIGAEL